MRTKYHFHRPGVDAFNMAKLGSKDKVGRVTLFEIQAGSWSSLHQTKFN